MNNKGAVFVAAVIARQTWTSEISLVGHENTVEVAAYNPHIFLRNPEVLKSAVSHMMLSHLQSTDFLLGSRSDE